MKLSNREIVLAWATGIALLIGGAYYFGEPQYTMWKESARERALLKKRISSAEKALERKPEVEKQLSEILSQLPRHPPNRDVTSDLLKTIQGTADKHQLQLIQRDPDSERKLGELYELTIKCTWEGELDALVYFLYDLQSQGATFDIRQLTVQPARGSPTRLKGKFMVDCAYSRDAAGTGSVQVTPAG